jgi:hypothetical protein
MPATNNRVPVLDGVQAPRVARPCGLRPGPRLRAGRRAIIAGSLGGISESVHDRVVVKSPRRAARKPAVEQRAVNRALVDARTARHSCHVPSRRPNACPPKQRRSRQRNEKVILNFYCKRARRRVAGQAATPSRSQAASSSWPAFAASAGGFIMFRPSTANA